MKELLADLTSGDDARAEKAITPLVELGKVAIGPLLELTRSQNADIRWWAVRALAASPHVETVSLIPYLNDSSSSVRAAAALAIMNHPSEEAVGALIKTLYDEDSLTATLASNALVKIGASATAPLLTVMEEANTNVRILAIRALSEIKDHRAIPIMMKCLNNENESAVIQYWAVQGLNKLGLDMVYINP
ncbi:MAG: HEAT repeat domain-containing protein [Anaerolineales bacterium]|nr:HEAT repeat domain-containing protein [Anaerolineales bacterium]MBX3035561.1 HEAT repeat domain-containing protein [Anaerolineales bacterium]